MNVILSRHFERLRRSKGTVLCSSLVLAACAVSLVAPSRLGAATPGTHQTAPATRFGVGIARCTFVDHSRPLLNYSTTPFSVRSASRTLVTEIRYPTPPRIAGPPEVAGAPAAPRSGGYPMIVFAHGYDVTPDTYAPLLDAWVQAGFVVVAPIFPDESAFAVADQPGVDTEDDLANEPADLAFVTRSILSISTNETSRCRVVHGLVAPSEIALAGHSDGATAVGMLAYDHGSDPQGINFAHLRTGIDYRAIIILSGAKDSSQSYADEASRPDLLDIQSRVDQCNPFRDGVNLYNSIHQTNKWFLELQTAHHLPPFDGVDRAAFNVASATTIRFLQLSLEGVISPPGLQALGNHRPAIARMYSGLTGPSPNAPVVPEKCGPN